MDSLKKFAVVVIAIPSAVALLEHALNKIGGGAFLWRDKECMPRELHTASIFMNEEPISCLKPIPIHGQVDQVFHTSRGKLIPLDTKTRAHHSIYESDIVQLSTYAVALRQMFPGMPVPHGYIRTVIVGHGFKSVRYHRVKLLSESQVVRIATS